MPAILQCACGHRVEVKDELVGRSIKCPNCGTPNTVTPAESAPPATGDAAFQRDKYLMKQQVFTIAEKYDIADEAGNPILFAERPRHFLRSMGALVGAVVTWIAVVVAGAMLVDRVAPAKETGEVLGDVLALVLVVAAFAAAIWVAIKVSPLRHTTIYRDEASREKLVEVKQDQKVALITATYSVRDAQGRALAKFRKNYLYNIIRKRWHVLSPSGRLLFVAMEDSIVLSLLRRLLGPLFGLLRTNFIIRQGEEGQTLGEFNRKLTLFDKYVLDLSDDRLRVLDRRLAVALGVMLDTGERR